MIFKYLERNFCCVLCKQKFGINKRKDALGEENLYPLLLQCGHSLCQVCLDTNMSIIASKKLLCKQCDNNVVIGVDSINCSLNYYINGYIQLDKNRDLSDLKKNSQSQLNSKINNCNKTACEECKSLQKGSCKTCNINLCTAYDDTVQISTDCNKTNLMLPKAHATKIKCSQHKNKYIQFYCKSCCMGICKDCLVLNHKGEEHCLANLTYMDEDIHIAVQEARQKLKAMITAIKTINATLDDYDTIGQGIYVDFKNKISSNFSRLHGLLQLEEEKILAVLDETAKSRKNYLKHLYEVLLSTFKSTSAALQNYDENVKNSRQSEDMSQLLKSLLNVQNLPCYLISEATKHDIQIEFRDDIVDLLRTYCTVRSSHCDLYRLSEYLSCEEFSLSNQRNKILQVISDGGKAEAECSSEKKMEEEKSFAIENSSLSYFTKNKTYSVLVNYIKSPEEFYVTLASDLSKRSGLEKGISEFALEISKTILKDEIYLVKYKFDNKWYRVKVIEVMSGESENVRVFNLDYGDLREVAASRLKCIPKVLLNEPPLAIKCKMYKWSSVSNEKRLQFDALQKKLVKCTRRIRVRNVHSNYLEVDFDLPGNHLEKTVEKVQQKLDVPTPDIKNVGPIEFDYPTQVLPKTGQTLDVIISHVNSISNFYVHVVNVNEDALIKLSNNLQNYYGKTLEKNYEKGILFNPRIGMPCAARYSRDNKWYRAKILKIVNKSQIQVFYIDYGNDEILDWKSLRKLHEQFLSPFPMAFDCQLCDFGACETLDFNNKSDLLGSTKPCKDYVGSNIPNHQENYLTEEAIIRDWNGSETTEKFHDLRIKNCSTEPFSQNINRSFTKLGRLKNQESQCNPKDAQENIFRPKIQILSANSPSSIYVTFPEMANDLTKLQSKLNSFYSRTLPEGSADRNWTVGDRCVLKSTSHNGWFRAVILEILPNEQVKAFLNDTAAIIVEPLTSLRLLDESFQKYPPHAFKCHMCDVYPIENSWPKVSCEFLSNEIETYEDIYMTKKGEIERGSLPIELWVQKKEIITGNSLKPTITWISLNWFLVEKGLALPMERMSIFSKLNLHKNAGVKDIESDLTEISKYTGSRTVTDKNKLPYSTKTVKWLASVPLKRSFFVGIPTYVDNDAVISVYNVEDEEKLRHIKETLFEKYADSGPDFINQSWSPGDICIAKYHLDNFWYRATVLKENEDMTYQVLFVDYGNVEICSASEIRKKVELTEIPILSYKLALAGIKQPAQSETWPVESIDFLHSSIVDKKCQVTVLKYPNNTTQPYSASLKILDSETEVSSYLENSGFAVFDVIQ